MVRFEWPEARRLCGGAGGIPVVLWGPRGLYADQGVHYTSEVFTAAVKEPRGKDLHGFSKSLGQHFVCVAPVVQCEIRGFVLTNL